MTDHTPAPSTLSPAGHDRKARMLTQLQTALSRRAARRRHLRAAGSIAACTLAVAAAWAGVVLSRSSTPPPQPPIARGTPDTHELPGAPALSHVQLVTFSAKPATVVVQTNPARIEQLLAPSTVPVRYEIISDDQLLDELETTGNSYGLMRSGTSVHLTCYSCPAPAPTEPPRDVPERPVHPD